LKTSPPPSQSELVMIGASTLRNPSSCMLSKTDQSAINPNARKLENCLP
jgi:hypothetical protein